MKMKILVTSIFLLGVIFTSSNNVNAYSLGSNCPDPWIWTGKVYCDKSDAGGNSCPAGVQNPGTCGKGACVDYPVEHAPQCFNPFTGEIACGNSWSMQPGRCHPNAYRTNYPWDAVAPQKPLCAVGSATNLNPADGKFPVGKYGVESRVTWRCTKDYGVNCLAQKATLCGTAAKNFSTDRPPREWTDATATSGYFCKKKATLTDANPKDPDTSLPVFPAPETVTTWKCDDADAGHVEECKAKNTLKELCGTAAKEFNQEEPPREWTDATATSGYFCQKPFTVTPPSPLPKFPKADETTTWKCKNIAGTRKKDCSATNKKTPASDICGTVAKEFFNQYVTPREWTDATATSGYFCKTGSSVTPVSPLPVFPEPGKVTTWQCNGADGSGTCQAKNSSEMPICPAWDNRVMTREELEAKTDTELCGTSGKLDRTKGIYLDDIYWRWGCVFKDPVPDGIDPNKVFAQCKAKNCLADTDFNEELYVYFKNDGTVDPAKFFIESKCPDLCCIYKNKSSKKEIKIGTCDGEDLKSGEIVVDGHPDDIERICTDGKRGVCKNGNCDKNLTIQCVCTAKRCTAQGTCADTPIFASSKADANCSAECSSNADCGGSKSPIETR